MKHWLILISSLLLFSGCTKKTVTEMSPVQKGRQVYNTHCTACHNANPKLDGLVGPAVFGSSLELLERRIVNGDYPPGYTPKRPSKQMVALPFLKGEIPALHAYLNNP